MILTKPHFFLKSLRDLTVKGTLFNHQVIICNLYQYTLQLQQGVSPMGIFLTPGEVQVVKNQKWPCQGVTRKL